MSTLIIPSDNSYLKETIDDGKEDVIISDFYCTYCGKKMELEKQHEGRFKSSTGEKYTLIKYVLYCPSSRVVFNEFEHHDIYQVYP